MIFQECKNIFPAMIKARSSVTEIVKDTKGNFGKYATLAGINSAIMPALAANGLTVVQEVSTEPGASGLMVTVETWLCHTSGEYIQFAPLALPVGDSGGRQQTAQAVGSAITYGRRYALMAALNLSADDDDGQAATDSKPAAKTTQRPPLRSEPPPEQDFGMAPNGNGDATKPPDDDEAELLDAWNGNAVTAKEWAVEIGACDNEFEASNSLKKIILEQFAGVFRKSNANAVLLAFMRRQEEKIAAKVNEAAA